MAVKLYDEMGTRYIINCLAGRFTSIMERYEPGTVFDLAECRFGPMCSNKLRSYYAKHKFINTEDDRLNRMLENNNEAAQQVIEPYEPLPIRKCDTIDQYLDLVETLPQGGKYEIQIDFGNIGNTATAVLLIMTRPDLDLDVRGCAGSLFDFVRDMWVSSAEHHEEYYELRLPDVITTKSVDGKYGSEFTGFLDEYTYIHNKPVLPKEFGNSQIIVLDKSISVSQEWRPTVEKCIGIFERKAAQANKKPGRTLLNYLQFREEL